MNTIVLKPFFHKEREYVGLYFDKNIALNRLLQKLAGTKWSQANRCWYIPLNQNSYNNVCIALHGQATLDIGMLKEYLEKRKKITDTAPTACEKTIVKPVPISQPVWKLSRENLEALEKYVQQLKLKGYSSSTLKTYKNEFIQLLRVLNKKPVEKLTTDELRRYFIYCHEKLQLTENSLHSRMNAIKFYFEQVQKREKIFWEIPRPKKPLLLPKLLNETELARLFNALTNKKHKAILFTA